MRLFCSVYFFRSYNTNQAMREVRECMENPFDGEGLEPMRGTITES